MVIKYIHTYVNTLNSPGSTNLWLRTASREQLRDPSGKCLQPWRPGATSTSTFETDKVHMEIHTETKQ